LLHSVPGRRTRMHLIPQSSSHLHMLVSIFPSLGLVFVLGFYITGFLSDNDGIKRTCLVLFGLLALLSVPTYFSGDGSAAAVASDHKISKDMISTHYGWGMAGLFTLVMTGVVAVAEFWRSRRTGRSSNDAPHLVLGLALVTLGLMFVADEFGWEIAHHE